MAPDLTDQPGTCVLIVGGMGGGSIGLYATAVACALNARADYVDEDPGRLGVAESLGAKVIEGLPPRLNAHRISVDASGKEEGLHLALRSTERGGVCSSAGIYYSPATPVPLLDMFIAGITFKTGRAHARPLIPKVLELVGSGQLDPGRITTEVADWEDAPSALCEYTTKLVIMRSGLNE